MSFQDLIGWLASALVLATFSARSMLPLRALAVGSNVAFVGYAYMAGLWPILLLHSIMLPLNGLRLREAISSRRHDTDIVPGLPQHGFAAVAANDNRQEVGRESDTALALA